MNHDQEAKRSMGGKIQVFLAVPDNAGQFAGYAPMTAASAKLTSILEDWDKLIAAEAVELQGPGAESLLRKAEMSKYWGTVAHTAVSWATEYGHTDEAADWSHTESDIFHEENNSAAGTCAHLYDSIFTHLADTGMGDHGIDSGVLTAGKALTNAFILTIGRAHEHRNEKSAVGVAIDTLVRERFDPNNAYMKGLVNGIFFIDKRDFVVAYNLASRIDNLPVHSTIASFHFTDSVSGDNLKGVRVHDLKSGKEALSDVMGNAEIRGTGFKGGKNLEFVCSLAGYATQTKVQTVKLGHHVSLAVAMVHI